MFLLTAPQKRFPLSLQDRTTAALVQALGDEVGGIQLHLLKAAPLTPENEDGSFSVERKKKQSNMCI